MHPSRASRLPQPVKDRLIAAADAVQLKTFFDFASHMEAWGSADDLDQLRMPVLLVNGQWEKAFQPKIPEAQAKIPELCVVDVEGGHAINAERAAEFNDAVLEFVSQKQPVS